MVEHPAFGFDWNLVRTFVAVAQMGSLAKGARSLGITHPTAARHVQLLEENLGFTLFTRMSQGLVLNDAGKRLAEAAEHMHQSALAFQSLSDGMRATPVTSVRITTADVLAELFSDLMLNVSLTDVAVDLVVTNEVLNLLQREADIAIRTIRPDQQELLCRRVGALSMGALASRNYVRQAGPVDQSNSRRHRFVDSLTHPHIVRGAAKRGIDIDSSQVAFRSDSVVSQLAAVRAGWGIGVFPLNLIQKELRHGGLVAVFPDNEGIEMDIWLAARPEVRDSDQLMAVFAKLGRALELELNRAARSAA